MPFCVNAANILLPKKEIDYKKFAVIACDQYTSEKEYWEELKNYVGDSISALNLILPEVYLEEDNTQKIKEINENINNYIKKDVFKEHKNCFIYTERSTPHTKIRRGLVVSVDLEAYSYNDKDKAVIRSSEGTVLSRIPPRVEIRKNAKIELPHIMLLIDDRNNSVIEPLQALKPNLECLYDTDLNMGGGHISGYKVDNTQDIINRLKVLTDPALLKQKYGVNEQLLIAVGDGNHSLATAKTIWENIKQGMSEAEREKHPARFVLAEIVNIHDDGIQFHPIHRVFFVKENKKFIDGLKELCSKFTYKTGTIVFGGKKESINLPQNSAEAVKIVQDYADSFTQKNGGYTDYVHGDDSVINICNRESAIGLLLPTLKKEDFFDYIIKKGSLPRKTFSMGEACEKRYYIEMRKITLN